MSLYKVGGRKFIVALIAITAGALRPESAVAIASIAAAFFGAHAAADWRHGKPRDPA